MEQKSLFDTGREKTPSYMKSRNGNAEFSPTFSDKRFVAQFDAYCRRNRLNKTETAQKWLMERLSTEIKDELYTLSKEQLIERILSE